MRLEDSRDNFWDGASKVVVSHPITGVSLEYTSDTTISIRELRALLIPTQELAFEIELFGGGSTSTTLTEYPFQFAPPFNPGASFTAVRTAGGYTKLKMIVPISDTGTISLQPSFYGGGVQTVPFRLDQRPSFPRGTWTTETSTLIAGYDAAAFSVNGEWMAAAGGGALYHVFQVQKDGDFDPGSGVRFFQQTYSNLVNPPTNDEGKGGVNLSNPTAAPSRGENQTFGGFVYSPSGTRGGAGASTDTTTPIGGGGAGGAPGGTAVDVAGGIPATAGEGNIRIYAETNGEETKGDLTSVPGAYMELLDSQNGSSLSEQGRAVIRVTSPVTGEIISSLGNILPTSAFSSIPNRDRTFTVKEFRNLLYPGVFPPD